MKRPSQPPTSCHGVRWIRLLVMLPFAGLIALSLSDEWRHEYWLGIGVLAAWVAFDDPDPFEGFYEANDIGGHRSRGS